MLLKELGEEETYYYHPDHLGSVSVVSNHKGEPYERVEYLPFGEVWIEETDPATSYIPFRFTSKEYDEETGLYYHGARYYEPRLSRWMSADPAGWELINPMDGDGEPVPDGWPEGFGPGPRVGMRPGYSVIEAANWYSYVSNNPVKYVDPTGMFNTSKIDKDYPKSSEFINSLQPSSDDYGAFEKYGQATKDDVDKAFTKGNLPNIIPKSLDGANGAFRPNSNSEDIIINKDLFEAFEEDVPGSDLLLESTIKHETTHYFDDQDGEDYPGEEGQAFEERVYGVDIDTLEQARRILENE